MAVEWLRSCYESEWFLFRDDPTRATAGEYYFSPDGAPFYSGWHRVGARVWHDKNWGHVQTLGESLTSKQEWDDGDLPAVRVLTSPIGETDCIENGETISNGVPAKTLQGGFLPECIIYDDELDRLWQIVSDTHDCCVQRVYAMLLQSLYETDLDAATKIVRDWIGPIPVITMHKHDGPRVGLLTLQTAAWFVGICDGTWNFQEFALQAVSFVRGPTNFGSLSTADLWWHTSTYVNNLMNDDGQNAGCKLMMVGHSYGGAVVLTSCARYRLWEADREIVYLTFGCPKIGDRRFVDIVNTCKGLNIAAEDDIVPSLPPDKVTLAPIVALFPLVPLYLYTEWLRPAPQALLRDNGTMDYQVYTLIDTRTILKIVTRVVAEQELDTIELHKMPRYITRMQTRCERQEAECNEPLDFVITYPANAIVFTPPRRPLGALALNLPSVIVRPITPGLPPFPGTLPDFKLGVIYLYIGGVQTAQTLVLKCMNVIAGTYRFTLIETAPMAVNQLVLMRTQIPPTWAIDDQANRNTVGFMDVDCAADGEGISLAFFDLTNTHTWNLVFRVDLL